MQIFFTVREHLSESIPCIYLLGENFDTLPSTFADNFPVSSLINYFQKEQNPTAVFLDNQVVFAVPYLAPTQENYVHKEKMRNQGNSVAQLIQKHSLNKLQVFADAILSKESLLCFLEGLNLGSYSYEKKGNSEEYFRDTLQVEVIFSNETEEIEQEELEQLTTLCDAVWLTRDLVNEPPNFKKPSIFGQKIQELGKEAGFEAEIWNKERIEAERMGGLLGISQASEEDAIFAKITYSPKEATNDTPIVLVGKGVTFDTGGTNIKTSMAALEIMKSDMGGAASVIGLIYALAKNNIPLYVIGLLPITDNSINNKALVPGDVITMRSGATVEVTNTDGEGRIIMADALDYAKELAPELVIDLATLTGSAVRSIGEEGTVFMGNADELLKRALEKSGRETYERLVEFPLWDEYKDYLKSDVADIKNVGGSLAGAITAGKFLEHFVDFDWIHMDIAAPAYLSKPSSYRGKNATGTAIRTLYHFLIEQFS
ncbi:leucyl aminopeptidase [Bernardetia litoralis DSM 6794]|uniref:Leucyl aminopeptidase n=1 Tax=Bernardetia litoralis (strain ATCC 23117 / DSM 6794 / NBRC 15988 / NCIMB 1366 / Fx l1 / Sio-4) TaxID=880071 RepID=I4AP19_BERLS|nr:leucyl aminopeptidase family protein [Bernardetia litoralis]AFM05704.1 leucyl aminopeptidase [Bernardetia litoralis DSM 6794]